MKPVTFLQHALRPCPRCDSPLFRMWEIHSAVICAVGCLRCRAWANPGGRTVQVQDVILSTS